MVMLNDAEYRQELLRSPGERQDVDYKSAIAFNSRDEFGLKLIRHIHGMANAGGGVLVIGYRESSGHLLTADPDMTDEIAASYEPTRLTQAVTKTLHRGQAVELTIHQERHPETNVAYPQIFVQPVRGAPLVCRSTLPDGHPHPVLRQGAVYIRRPGAETSEASTPADYESLIRRAQQSNRDTFLAQLRELIGSQHPQNPPSASDRINDRIARGRQAALNER